MVHLIEIDVKSEKVFVEILVAIFNGFVQQIIAIDQFYDHRRETRLRGILRDGSFEELLNIFGALSLDHKVTDVVFDFGHKAVVIVGRIEFLDGFRYYFHKAVVLERKTVLTLYFC